MALNLGELTLLMKVDDAQSKGKLADMQKQIDDLTKKVNALSENTTKASGSMTKFAGIVGGIGIGAVVGMASHLAQMSYNANMSIKVFEGLGGSMAKLREATYHMIDDQTLAQKANLAETMGISSKDFEKLAVSAKAAAAKTGQDMGYMFDSIITGTVRQSKLILDNLGILVNAEKAQETYARSLGKTAKELTDLEKKQAFTNEVIRQGEKMIGEIGKTGASLVNPFSQAHAAFKNLMLEIGTALQPAGEKIAQFATKVMDTFREMIPWIKEGAKAFVAIQTGNFKDLEEKESTPSVAAARLKLRAQASGKGLDALFSTLNKTGAFNSKVVMDAVTIGGGEDEFTKGYKKWLEGKVKEKEEAIKKAEESVVRRFFRGPGGNSPWDKDGHVKFGEGYTMDPSAKGYMAGMFGALGMGGALFGGANQNGAALMAQANQRQEWLIKIAQIMDKWDRSSGGARPGYGTSAEVNSLTGTGMSPAARAKAERDRRNTAEYNANLADMQKGVALGVIQGLTSGEWISGLSNVLSSKALSGGAASAGIGAGVVGGLLQEVLTTFKTNIENVFIKPLKDLMEPLIGVFKGKAMSTMQIFLSAVGAATTHLMAMGPVAAYFLGPFAALGSAAVASGTAILQLSTQTKSYARVQKILELGADRVVQALEPFWQRMVPLAVVFGEMFTVVAHVLEALMPWQGVFKGLYTAANQLELAFLGVDLAVQNAMVEAIIPFAEWLYRMSHNDKNSDALARESDAWKTRREETRALYANARNRKYDEAMGEGLDLVKAIQNINSSVYNGPAGFKVESYRYKAMEAVDGGVDMDAAGLNRPRTFADKEAQKQTQILQDMLVTLRDEKNLTLSVGGEKMTVAMERLLAQREHYRSGGTMTRPSKVITRP